MARRLGLNRHDRTEIDSQDKTDGTGQPEQINWEKPGRKVSRDRIGPPNMTTKNNKNE
jgi:hypothetical protein